MDTHIEIKQEIYSLAAQLEKLLKVINHSDPTAKNKKLVLHEKYKRHLEVVAGAAKKHYRWDDVMRLINTTSNSADFPIAEDVNKIITKKLLKDFEDQFVSRYVLNEFTAPDPGDEKQKERIRRIRNQIRTNRKNSEKKYTRDNLLEIVQLRDQQRCARKSLDKLINAVNKLNPEVLEAQIKQFIESKD